MQNPPPYATQTGSLPATGFAGTSQLGSGLLIFDREYLSKWTGGVLKFIEMGVCLLVIICNNVNLTWQTQGGGWVNFVVIMAIFGSAFSLFLHSYNIPSKTLEAGSYRLAEFIVYVVWCVFWLIAGIVAAAVASQNAGYSAGPPIAACAFFCFAALVVYVADTYFIGVEWRTGGVLSGGSGAPPYNNFPGTNQSAGATVTVSSGPTAAVPSPYASQPSAGSAYTTFASPSVLGDKPAY